MKRTYSDKLRDPRWQQKRLKLLEAAEWKCWSCESGTTNLQVHHQYYLRNTDPWDYEDDCYKVLCEDCHKTNQKSMETAHKFIARFHLILVLEEMSKASEDEQDSFFNIMAACLCRDGRPKLLSACSSVVSMAFDIWRCAQNHYQKK